MKQLLIPLLFLMTLVLADPSLLAAEEYELPLVHVEVEVNPDGTLRITEHFTYDFEGAFSWAHRSLPIGEGSGYREIRDVRITESGEAFINENSERPGTFLVQRSDDMIDFRWFFEAEDERRTFTIAYTLDGAVVIGPDWSEFFWTYLARGREMPTDSLSIDIRLPREVQEDSLHAWARGPRQRISVTPGSGGYRAAATGIGDGQHVKIRTIFPVTVFDRDSVSVTDSNFTLARTQQDEQQFRQEQQRREEYEAWLAEIGLSAALLLALLSIGFFSYFYNRYGKRHNVSATGTSRRSLVPPGREKPALIGWLLSNRTTSGGHLMATLLDLARMGYFKLQEQPPEKAGWLTTEKPAFTITSNDKEPDPGLLRWEADMLEFVRDRLDEEEMKLKELFKQHSSDFSKWFSSWKGKIKDDAFSRGWIDEESYPGAWWNAGVQAFLLLASIACIVMAGPIALFAAVICFALAFASFGIIRRTPEGETLYQNWKGYKSALSEAEDYSVRRDELDRHFIYAVALGAGKDDIKALFTANPNAATSFAWIVVLHSSSSPASLATTFSTLNATGTAAFGGAAGAAGGATAGAAGGGGSAGAG